MSIYLSIIAAYLACATSLALTPVIRRLAEKYDFVDRPDGRRKTQQKPVALGGGVSLFLSCAATMALLAYLYSPEAQTDQRVADWLRDTLSKIESPQSLLGLGYAAILLCLVGLLDDLVGMRGSIKLIWQLVAASLIVTLGNEKGLWIDQIIIGGVNIELGFLGIPLAMFWILGAINSVNLIDGMDGLATTVGFIFSVTLGIMALITQHELDAIIAFSMAGALLGFLRYNRPPARIYLGDSGSMLIGVVLGTLALRCRFKEATTIAIAAPLAVWAIPILDAAAALLRRKLTGRSMYATDRGHIHHRLLTRGLSNNQALLLIAAFCVVTSAGGIASIYYQTAWYGMISIAVVVLLLVGTRVFGHSELMLLNNHLIGFGRNFLQRGDTKSSSIQLQGSLQWERVWEGLIESAERFHLTRIRLNVFLPQLHEDFFATWERKRDVGTDHYWSAEIPLVVDDQLVGYLNVTGVQPSGSSGRMIADFAELVEPLEAQVEGVLTANRAAAPREAPVDEEPESSEGHKAETKRASVLSG